MARNRLVIAIDYGTSSSGAAYTYTSPNASNDDGETHITVLDEWSEKQVKKTPSDIAYEYGCAVSFGYEASRSEHAVQWVKLMLETKDLKNERHRPDAKLWAAYTTLGELDKKPVQVVTDYLTWLWASIKKQIQEREANSKIFTDAELAVVLTVPASWQENAKRHMERAAIDAGIPQRSIKMISEPEAAAIFGLKDQVAKNTVKKGDCVIVCDAGGGTVDVVAYQIRSTEPLSLDQVTIPQGDLCGSTFINSEFDNQLRQILGEDRHELDAEDLMGIADHFEMCIKREYDPEHPKSYTIRVPGLQDDEGRKIKRGKMTIDTGALDLCFESIMTAVMSLLDSQIQLLKDTGLQSKLQGILLVGGFSDSKYLRARIKQEFPDKNEHNDLKIWRGVETLTAVVRGAVLCEGARRDRQSIVHQRLSAYNYGIPYIQGGNRKVDWFVRKSQPVQPDQCSKPYALRLEDQPWLAGQEFGYLSVTLVKSDEDNASDDYGPAVIPYATIDCKIPTKCRLSNEAYRLHKDQNAWLIPAKLVLHMDGAVVSFRCQVQNEDVGVATINWLQEPEEGDPADRPDAPLAKIISEPLMPHAPSVRPRNTTHLSSRSGSSLFEEPDTKGTKGATRSDHFRTDSGTALSAIPPLMNRRTSQLSALTSSSEGTIEDLPKPKPKLHLRVFSLRPNPPGKTPQIKLSPDFRPPPGIPSTRPSKGDKPGPLDWPGGLCS